MTYEAVFLDLDDTLYPYPPCNEAGKRAAFETFLELGYDLDREGFEALYQEGRRAVKRELSGTASAHERFLYFKRAIDLHAGTHRSEHALRLGEAYWDAYVDEMTLFDGVAETLATLQDAGVDVAVVTNLTTRIQLKKLHRLDLDRHVDLLLTSEETGREKPSSVMFTLPLARLDRRPGEVLMVGDDVEADLEGANAVGLGTAAFNGPDDVADLPERCRPDHTITDFTDLTEVVL
ncbi:HAD family hydrolase [Halorarum halophilum]|uniref:HAD family hydrolase n=1 Tax=Halorarum halophilum TaxID=2743090 RepID=A0A7D5KFQ1_9EURY|nr:HAD family hydrolase [Halobaculum halophilum]QLG29177.1 HAD family hydrolase [Halobaculum halophilum]